MTTTGSILTTFAISKGAVSNNNELFSNGIRLNDANSSNHKSNDQSQKSLAAQVAATATVVEKVASANNLVAIGNKSAANASMMNNTINTTTTLSSCSISDDPSSRNLNLLQPVNHHHLSMSEPSVSLGNCNEGSSYSSNQQQLQLYHSIIATPFFIDGGCGGSVANTDIGVSNGLGTSESIKAASIQADNDNDNCVVGLLPPPTLPLVDFPLAVAGSTTVLGAVSSTTSACNSTCTDAAQLVNETTTPYEQHVSYGAQKSEAIDGWMLEI